MKKVPSRSPMLLSVFPNSYGIGFAVFEGPRNPIAWGVKRALPGKEKNKTSLNQVRLLFRLYQPDILILEAVERGASRRRARTTRLLRSIVRLAQRKGVRVHMYTRDSIRVCFAPYEASTKEQIAWAIAQSFPELVPLVPTTRRLWQSENHRMGVFDAFAFALTHYANEDI